MHESNAREEKAIRMMCSMTCPSHWTVICQLAKAMKRTFRRPAWSFRTREKRCRMQARQASHRSKVHSPALCIEHRKLMEIKMTCPSNREAHTAYFESIYPSLFYHARSAQTQYKDGPHSNVQIATSTTSDATLTYRS